MNTHRHDRARAAAAACGEAWPFVGGLMALTALAALALMPVAARGAEAPTSAKEKPLKLEAVAGSSVKRVTLSARAAERLGIKTGVVGEDEIAHKRLVGGLVLPVSPAAQSASADPASGGPTPVSASASPQVAAADDVWVSVALSPGELNSLALDRPARVIPLARDGGGGGMTALPSKLSPILDQKRSMWTLHYVVHDADKLLKPLQRVLIELKLNNDGVRRKVVPTSAVLHDHKGAAWVYVNPAPLTYQREPLRVERIVGDLTVLADGPPVGATIVTVGAPMLYGTEVYGK